MQRPSRSGSLAAILLTFACGAFAQADEQAIDQATARIRPAAIRAHMEFLADDLLEGRGTGSRGYDIAAKYVATQLAAAGLEPAGVNGTYFQPVPFRKSVAEEKESFLTLQRQDSKATLRYGADYVMRVDSLVHDLVEVNAPVVFVGFGVTAPEMSYDDYAGVDVRGKIIALLTDAPAAFPHNQRAYYSSTRLKGENAVAHGAVGVFIISSRDDRKSFPWGQVARHSKMGGMRWLDAAGKPDEVWPEFRASAWLSEEGAAALFQGAPKTLDQALDDAEASKPQGFELPVRATVKSVAHHTRVESPNVVAMLRGSDPQLREQFVVYSGHLDHLGVSEPVDGDAINNGAFDNASGIAALIEVAKAFAALPKPPRRSLLFLAVAGEEKGLRGSEYFARHPTVPRQSLVANVNLDMFVMPFPLRDVVAFGAEHSSLGPVVDAAARRVGFVVSPDPMPEEVIFIRSDQYSFVRQGVPAVFITHGSQSADPKVDGPARILEWMRTKYHRPNDDMSQPMDLESGAKFARLNFLIGYDVAQADQPPTWNPGDFFGEKFGKKQKRMRLFDLVSTSQRVAETRARSQKIAALADLLRRLEAAEIDIAVAYLSGHLRQGRIGLGGAAVRNALPGTAAAEPSLSLTEVDAAFERLAGVSGAGSMAERGRLLSGLLSRATREEQDFLVRLIYGELRQGALAGLMAEALAAAAAVPADEVRRALMLAGELPAVARAVLTEGRPGLGRFHLQLFRPLQPMLAQPAGDVSEALERLGEAALELKLDGARVQVHKAEDDVRVYSRRGNDVTHAVPELVEAVQALPARQLLLDGEVIALRPDGTPHPFQITMRRFGRKLDVPQMRGELPLTPFFFDLLHLDGDDLIDRPAGERFAALVETVEAVPGLAVPRRVTADPEEADAFFEEALRRGHEGIMAKAVDAPYEAGKRGFSWLKVKPAHTLDLVVLAAEWGHGRRKGWLSNLHLGARDPENGAFVMLGKTFKGLTDETLAWQTRKLQELALSTDGWTVYVRPELVVEIALSDVQESPHYPAGMALRFARVKRYREDKSAAEADTIDTVRKIFAVGRS